jgi:hypothetical protein
MALYQDVSPSAPVSREELAAILAAQGLSGASTNNPGDPGDVAATGRGFGGNAFDGQFGTGAPPANSNPDDNAAVNQGDMVTANASMINDPDTTGYTNAPFGGRTGDDSSQTSQDKQSADRAAIAEAVAGRAPAGDPLGDATQAFGSFTNTGANMFGNVGDMTPGAVLGSGHAQTQSGMPGFSNPSAFAASAFGSPFAGRGGPDREGFGSVIAEGPGAPGWDTGDTGNHAIADMLADALADPGWGGGVVAPGGGGGARSGGAATTGGFNEGAANQGIADMMGAALADPGWGGGANAPGSGGYGPDFAGTGGYSGSGDVGNTSGAGGAVGGFGGGVGGSDGAGAGAGAGAGTGSGNDSGSDGASGGVG